MHKRIDVRIPDEIFIVIMNVVVLVVVGRGGVRQAL
jgi:hypothetical protein